MKVLKQLTLIGYAIYIQEDDNSCLRYLGRAYKEKDGDAFQNSAELEGQDYHTMNAAADGLVKEKGYGYLL